MQGETEEKNVQSRTPIQQQQRHNTNNKPTSAGSRPPPLVAAVASSPASLLSLSQSEDSASPMEFVLWKGTSKTTREMQWSTPALPGQPAKLKGKEKLKRKKESKELSKLDKVDEENGSDSEDERLKKLAIDVVTEPAEESGGKIRRRESYACTHCDRVFVRIDFFKRHQANHLLSAQQAFNGLKEEEKAPRDMPHLDTIMQETLAESISPRALHEELMAHEFLCLGCVDSITTFGTLAELWRHQVDQHGRMFTANDSPPPSKLNRPSIQHKSSIRAPIHRSLEAKSFSDGSDGDEDEAEKAENERYARLQALLLKNSTTPRRGRKRKTAIERLTEGMEVAGYGQFSCDKCGQRFKAKNGTYYRHMQSHWKQLKVASDQQECLTASELAVAQADQEKVLQEQRLRNMNPTKPITRRQTSIDSMIDTEEIKSAKKKASSTGRRRTRNSRETSVSPGPSDSSSSSSPASSASSSSSSTSSSSPAPSRSPEPKKLYKCACGKQYKRLWLFQRHMNVCKLADSSDEIEEDEEDKDDSSEKSEKEDSNSEESPQKEDDEEESKEDEIEEDEDHVPEVKSVKKRGRKPKKSTSTTYFALCPHCSLPQSSRTRYYVHKRTCAMKSKDEAKTTATTRVKVTTKPIATVPVPTLPSTLLISSVTPAPTLAQTPTPSNAAVATPSLASTPIPTSVTSEPSTSSPIVTPAVAASSPAVKTTTLGKRVHAKLDTVSSGTSLNTVAEDTEVERKKGEEEDAMDTKDDEENGNVEEEQDEPMPLAQLSMRRAATAPISRREKTAALTCNLCQESFTAPSSLARHSASVHPNEDYVGDVFKCTGCNAPFKFMSKVRRHTNFCCVKGAQIVQVKSQQKGSSIPLKTPKPSRRKVRAAAKRVQEEEEDDEEEDEKQVQTKRQKLRHSSSVMSVDQASGSITPAPAPQDASLLLTMVSTTSITSTLSANPISTPSSRLSSIMNGSATALPPRRNEPGSLADQYPGSGTKSSVMPTSSPLISYPSGRPQHQSAPKFPPMIALPPPAIGEFSSSPQQRVPLTNTAITTALAPRECQYCHKKWTALAFYNLKMHENKCGQLMRQNATAAASTAASKATTPIASRLTSPALTSSAASSVSTTPLTHFTATSTRFDSSLLTLALPPTALASASQRQPAKQMGRLADSGSPEY